MTKIVEIGIGYRRRGRIAHTYNLHFGLMQKTVEKLFFARGLGIQSQSMAINYKRFLLIIIGLNFEWTIIKYGVNFIRPQTMSNNIFLNIFEFELNEIQQHAL
jgi:hypothetical protein